MKRNTSTVKTIIAGIVSILSVLWIFGQAATPNFSISPSTLTGKLHCSYRFSMVLNPDAIGYNAFESTIQFDSWSAQIIHESINPLFNNITSASINSGYLYNARWTMLPGQTSLATINALTFRFKTIQNITGTTLDFTTLNGNAIVFDPNLTDDGATINASWSSYDILSGVTHGVYTFVPLPCVPDQAAPSMWWNYPSNGDRYVADNTTISLTLYDRAGAWSVNWPAPLATNDRQHYRYSGNDTSSLNNYVPAPSSVDNQEGVNSGSISITLDCPTCTSWSRPYVFTSASPALIINERTGNSSIHMLTWQNKIRGYTLSIPAPSPYEIEKQVYVNISVTDNPNEYNETNTWTPSFSFNAPENPTITRIQPSTAIDIPPNFGPFVFNFEDDRAGIDTGSISITIPEYSSWSKFYTGHTYSGNELTFTLIWGTPGTGNAWSYQVAFTPLRPLPSNSTLQITWVVYDLAGNEWTYSAQFSTTMSCIDRGCADFFTVDILGGLNIGTYTFTWDFIYITWTNTNSPYPYFTGINNDILMCGRPYTGTILTGNIWIFDTTGNSIKGTTYTEDELYITGLDGIDFIYSNGTIIIN